MQIFVGTSGWSYSWNDGRNFDWYVANSNLNAVELNASFYHFPYPNVINSWASKGTEFHWSIKVNRLITHRSNFDESVFQKWLDFHKLFQPLVPFIDFFLFQLPPSKTPEIASQIENFANQTNLKKCFALEIRNIQWFEKKWISWATKIGITLVSVDSPDFPLEIFNTSDIVYLRMHGRKSWYNYDYSNKELTEIVEKILLIKPKKVYVFFNNNHGMLENAKRMLDLFNEKIKKT